MLRAVAAMTPFASPPRSSLSAVAAVAALAATVVAGCSTTNGAARDLAAQQLGCPSSSVRLQRVDRYIFSATGCGASVDVACYDPHENTGAAKGWSDPATAGNRVRCEALLPRPTVTSAPVAAPASAAPSAGAFDRGLAAKLLGASAERARSCGRPGGPAGQGRARVTFSTDGSISTIELDAPFRDTEVGRCVVREMSRVSLTPFEGQPVTVGKHFVIGGSHDDAPGGATDL